MAEGWKSSNRSKSTDLSTDKVQSPRNVSYYVVDLRVFTFLTNHLVVVEKRDKIVHLIASTA